MTTTIEYFEIKPEHIDNKHIHSSDIGRWVVIYDGGIGYSYHNSEASAVAAVEQYKERNNVYP